MRYSCTILLYFRLGSSYSTVACILQSQIISLQFLTAFLNQSRFKHFFFFFSEAAHSDSYPATSSQWRLVQSSARSNGLRPAAQLWIWKPPIPVPIPTSDELPKLLRNNHNNHNHHNNNCYYNDYNNNYNNTDTQKEKEKEEADASDL